MRSTMSLSRTLLYLLSLSSISLARDQDVLQPDQPFLEFPSHSSLVLITKTVTYDEHVLPTLPTQAPNSPLLNTPENATISCFSTQKQCANTCIPSTQDCCSASEHCFPGDYCYHHSGEIRCCPEGLECYQLSGDVCFDQTIVWYEEVHIVEGGDDEDDREGQEQEVVTSWELRESFQETKTRVTVTASYPAEGRASFAALSQSFAEAATATSLSLVLDFVPTRTVTISKTPTATAESFLDDLWLGSEGQVIMDF
ncbi:hypothetical protein BDV06DRAFT_201547 [Aspergillus oleicola]